MQSSKNEVKDARQEIRLSSSDKEKLKIIARKKGVNVSELIMLSLEPYLKEFQKWFCAFSLLSWYIRTSVLTQNVQTLENKGLGAKKRGGKNLYKKLYVFLRIFTTWGVIYARY